MQTGNSFIDLSVLLQNKEVQDLLHEFYVTMKTAIAIQNNDQQILLSYGYKNYCAEKQDMKEKTLLCPERKDKKQEIFNLPSGLKVHKCEHGLSSVNFPIIVEQKVMGNVLLGQFLLDPKDAEIFRKVLHKKNYTQEEIQNLITSLTHSNISRGQEHIHFLQKMFQLILGLILNKIRDKETNEHLDMLIQQESVELLETNKRLQNEIVERKHTEQELRKSEERFRSIFEQTSIGVITVTVEGNLSNCNEAFLKMLKILDKEEIIGKNINRFIEGSDHIFSERHTYLMIEGLITSNIAEIKYIRSDKKIMWGRTSVSYISRSPTGSPEFFVGMIEDITEQKKAEQSLRDSEKRFRSMIENAPEAVLVCQIPDLKMLLVNKSMESLTEYKTSELLQMDLFQLLTDDFSYYDEFLSEMKLRDSFHIPEHSFTTKNGNAVPVDVIATKIIYKNNECMLCFVRDITERKKILENIKKALQKEKELNILKSRFVSTVSHEFRTPISVIKSSVQLLNKFSNKWEDDKKQKLYNKVFKAIDHTNGLINNVLLEGKDESGQLSYNPTPTHFEEFCLQIIEETQIVFDEDIILSPEIQSNFGTVLLDQNLLRHVFTNLISNAIKYSSSIKKVLFSVSGVSKNKAKIRIEDNGIGIPKEDLKFIFDPFHRGTNAKSIQGTGLGMSIVKRCVELHKGKIHIESEENKGTTVEVIITFDL